MSFPLDLRDIIIRTVTDDTGRIADEYDMKLAEAIRRYSGFKPAIEVEDIIGAGSNDIDMPQGWVDDFSIIQSVEHPPGRMPANILDTDEYQIYQSPDGKKLRLLTLCPSTTELIRVTYTIMRTDGTIPDADIDAVCNLAAALCLDLLANQSVQSGDPTIAADSVNYRTKSSEYAARAKRHMQLYKEHMGIKDGDTTPAASAIVSHTENYPGGMDRLTHPRSGRRRR
jgi:hypothetical protein